MINVDWAQLEAERVRCKELAAKWWHLLLKARERAKHLENLWNSAHNAHIRIGDFIAMFRDDDQVQDLPDNPELSGANGGEEGDVGRTSHYRT